MDNRKTVFLCVVSAIMFFNQSIDAYVTGYTKLYRESTGTTVDLLHDWHEENHRIPIKMNGEPSLSDKELIKHLYPTEQKVITALGSFNKQGLIDLIWESDARLEPRGSSFICVGEFLIQRNFPRINFIKSDQWRLSFESLFKFCEPEPQKNTVGSTFDNPFPLPQEQIDRIGAYSGQQAQVNYLRQHAELTEQIKNYYGGFLGMSVDYNYYFLANELHSQIADVEMLSHILASDKKRIVVYAGGWHCRNLQQILHGYGYRVINSKSIDYDYEGDRSELSVSELSGLDGHKYLSPFNPVNVIKKPVKKHIVVVKKKGKKKRRVS